MRQMTQIIRFGAPAAGFMYGSVVAITFPHRAAPSRAIAPERRWGGQWFLLTALGHGR